MTTSTVIAIGEAMIELRSAADDLHATKRVPTPDPEQGALNWTFAGDTLNSSVALASAAPDADVHFLTGIGDDRQSRDLVEMCARLGVDASSSIVVPMRHLGIYWIEAHGQERRFQYWRNESAAKTALGAGINIPVLGRGDAVVLSGITLAVAGGNGELIAEVDRAGTAGATIGFDVNHRSALWSDRENARTAYEQQFSISKIVVASVDDVAEVWGVTADEFCDHVGRFRSIEEVVVTDGPAGVVSRADGNTVRHQASAVVPVDTTGAGDAFFGTYVGQRITGASVEAAIGRAMEHAAHVVAFHGGLGHRVRVHRPPPP